MAGSYNRVILVGNLTRDPEIRYTQSGKGVTKFTLAVNNPRNKRRDDLRRHRRVGPARRNVQHLFQEGLELLWSRAAFIRSYDDKDGNKRKATEVVIDNMQMLGRRAIRSAAARTAPRLTTAAAARRHRARRVGGDKFGDELEDEIPF